MQRARFLQDRAPIRDRGKTLAAARRLSPRERRCSQRELDRLGRYGHCGVFVGIAALIVARPLQKAAARLRERGAEVDFRRAAPAADHRHAVWPLTGTSHSENRQRFCPAMELVEHHRGRPLVLFGGFERARLAIDHLRDKRNGDRFDNRYDF